MSGPGYPPPWQQGGPPGPPLPPMPPVAPPPRRRGGLVAIVVIGVVAALVAVGAGVYLGSRNSADQGDVPAPSRATATSGRIPGTATTAPRTRATAGTITPSPRPTARPSTARPTTPRPTEPPSRAQIVGANALYAAPALRDANCPGLPDASLGDEAGVRAFYAAVLPCLNTAWSQLRGDRLPFRPAKLVVHSGEQVSECGAYAYSFYCPSEQTIYMYAPEMITPWRQYPTAESHRITRLAALHTIAHEYGHHVQELTGIFEAAYSDGRSSTTEREIELQATCLGNVFLGSQRSAFPISSGDLAQQDLWRVIVRLPHHGSGTNQALWADRGYRTERAGYCNTFRAPRSQVG